MHNFTFGRVGNFSRVMTLIYYFWLADFDLHSLYYEDDVKQYDFPREKPFKKFTSPFLDVALNHLLGRDP